MKKIIILITFLSTTLFAVGLGNSIMDDLFLGITASKIEEIKKTVPATSLDKYLLENKYEIMDNITNAIYTTLEDQYELLYDTKIEQYSIADKLFNKDNLTQEQQMSIFREIMTGLLNYYGYTNSGVTTKINNKNKKVEVAIKSKLDIDNYNKQLFNALITNIIKAITTEEYSVEIEKIN